MANEDQHGSKGLLRLAATIMLSMTSTLASAEGGPPLVTDDPETPGDGHWEINLATIGAHTSGRWDLAAPDADINYGWGEHIQLKVDAPWEFAHESRQPWKTDWGAPIVGVKWRFIDIEDAGFSMSTYPQYTRNWLSSTANRGINPSGGQFFLPIEVATQVGEFSLDAEAGANFVQYGTTQWMLGGIVAHSCGRALECLGEVRQTIAPNDSQTLLNVGLHWKLNESMFVLAAAGRQFGQHTDDQQRLLFYLGIQLLR